MCVQIYGTLTVTVQLSRGQPGLSPQAVQFSGQIDTQIDRYTAAFIEVAPQLKNAFIYRINNRYVYLGSVKH